MGPRAQGARSGRGLDSAVGHSDRRASIPAGSHGGTRCPTLRRVRWPVRNQPSHRVKRHSSHRSAALTVALAAAMAWMGAACSASPSAVRHEPTSSSSAASTTLPPPSVTTTSAPVAGHRDLAVTKISVTFTDTTRAVTSGGRTLAPERALPTIVWLPSTADRLPLVVFAHGYDVGPDTYSRFCTQLASTGYVVAAPSFPLEDPSRGNGLDRSDLPNEAADVSFVISSMASDARFASRLAAPRVAVVGHSDGADVALMVGYAQGHVDPRVRAIVADAPDPITDQVVPSDVPLLLVQGDADDVVPYSSSQTVF